MKKNILLLLLGVILSGCVGGENIEKEQVEVQFAAEEVKAGRIGDHMPITRAQGAKMIALAFYESKELSHLEKKMDFKDLKDTDWFFPYINGAVALELMAGEGDCFNPQSPMTLAQTQILMDKLNPDNHTKIKITEENKDKPVAYSLWMELFQEALQGRRGEDSLYSYGFREQEMILLEQMDGETILTTEGMLQRLGYDLKSYENRKLKVLIKGKEIVALLQVIDMEPVIENAYFRGKKGGIEIDTGRGKKFYAYEGDFLEETGYIGDICLKAGKAAEVISIENKGKDVIKRVDESHIFLEKQGELPWDENAKVYQEKDNRILRKKVSRLICGTDIADFYERDGKVCAAVIRRKAVPHNIRVLLSTTGFQGYEHEKVILTASENFTIWGGAVKKEYKGGEEVTLTLAENQGLFEQGRAYAKTQSGGAISLKSISKNGKAPSYVGILELEKGEKGFKVVNELPLEEYVRGVVPGEMPVSFGLEALKVQSVAARSYAYNQFYANRYGNYGAHVDDSTNSQVYEGAATHELSDEATRSTSGICVAYGKTVVNANFFSTSAGMTANSGEVWAGKNGEDFPSDTRAYLVSKKQGLEKDYGDLSKDENAAVFLKDRNIKAYDSLSPWFRWQVTITGAELTAIVNRGVQEISEENTKLVAVLQKNGSWEKGPATDLGEIKRLLVVQRGQGGNAMVLEAEGEKGTVRISTEYAIRKVLRPAKAGTEKDVILQLSDGSERINYNLLPSGFFVIEQKTSADGVLEAVTLFGGGNGHGVGMSQYGAKGMAEAGFGYDEILAHYFHGAKAQKVISKEK